MAEPVTALLRKPFIIPNPHLLMSTSNTSAMMRYTLLLLGISGLGGLLYGIDIGIIDPALGYLDKSIRMSDAEKSAIVAAVLFGSTIASLIAGFFADLIGRKKMMIISALMFVTSVALIFTSQSYELLMVGRILQGMSGGVIAVVVPLYLAECLRSDSRGKGTSIFQFMLTFGIVVAAVVGKIYIDNAEAAIKAAEGNAEGIRSAADHAWRGMFLMTVYPGVVFLIGSFFLTESPRWLYRKNRVAEAKAALMRSRTEAEADFELAELKTSLEHEHSKPKVNILESAKEIFTQRKYVLPFVIACVILGCNQATGINSILGYMTTILQQAGLSAETAAASGLYIKILNCVMTVVAVMLVDRKGRKFLLKLGTGGIIAALLAGSAVFYGFESKRVEVVGQIAPAVADNSIKVDLSKVDFGNAVPKGEPVQLVVVYQQGDKKNVATGFSTKNAKGEVTPFEIKKETDKVTDKKTGVVTETVKPLTIISAKVGPIPSTSTGIQLSICLAFFIAAFSVGPGVCVWLALSELMPTRIRSVGMGVALLINQAVSGGIAFFFLPIVGNFGYHAMFGFWAACTVIYFVTAAFFLPETKGKTLEEIEEYFEGKKKSA